MPAFEIAAKEMEIYVRGRNTMSAPIPIWSRADTAGLLRAPPADKDIDL